MAKAGIFFLIALVAVSYITYTFNRDLPNPNVLKSSYPEVLYNFKTQNVTVNFTKQKPSHWVTIDQIPKNVVGAVVISEDWAFFQHNGYDPNQIKEAIRESIRAKKFTRGASTITQQVAKNVFLSNERTLQRKIRELLLSIRIETNLPKNKILEIYFNIAEWAEGVYGIKRAADFYFQKHPSQLNTKEGAFLAMLLPSPIRYGKSFRDNKLSPYAKSTIDDILDKMVQAKYFDAEDREKIASIPLVFNHPHVIATADSKGKRVFVANPYTSEVEIWESGVKSDEEEKKVPAPVISDDSPRNAPF